jgi:hypothetical protein
MAEPFNAFGGRWGWLAPVMGCFLVLMVVSGSRSNQLSGWSGASKTDWLEAVANHQSYAAYAAAGFHSEQNSLRQDPIEWTNEARLPGEAGAVLRVATNNSLIR